MSEPLIYAELLSNIRQISIIVVLEAPCDSTAQVEISENGRRFVLRLGGETFILNLPGRVSPRFQPQKPILGSKELSWRLPLAPQISEANATPPQGNDGPWSAKVLGEESEFSCRDCGAIIIGKGSIKAWKDLPSENWAEMMEFWHCHKPDVPKANGSSDHHNADELQARRGYGANTKFVATMKTGFVDITTFLLTDSDCTNIQAETSSKENQEYHILSCRGCSKYLGRIDPQAEGYRLFKWRLQPIQTTHSSLPSMSSILTEHLAAIIQSQCISRLIIVPIDWKASTGLTSIPPTDSKAFPTFLSFWILTPSFRYSSNTTLLGAKSGPSKANESIFAMKIFWKVVTAQAAEAMVGTTGVEDITLPGEAIRELESCLRGSAALLPPSTRIFQDWNVGILERYEE